MCRAALSSSRRPRVVGAPRLFATGVLLVLAGLACPTACAQDDSSGATSGQTSIEYPWRPGRPAGQARSGWTTPGTRDWSSAVRSSYARGSRLARYPNAERVQGVSANAPAADPVAEDDGAAAALPDGAYAPEEPAYFEHDPRFARTVRGPYFGDACAGAGICDGIHEKTFRQAGPPGRTGKERRFRTRDPACTAVLPSA